MIPNGAEGFVAVGRGHKWYRGTDTIRPPYRSVYTLTHRASGPRRSAGVEITRTFEPNGGNRNGQGSRLNTNFRPQNYGAVAKTLLATTVMAECYDFQWVLP